LRLEQSSGPQAWWQASDRKNVRLQTHQTDRIRIYAHSKRSRYQRVTTNDAFSDAFSKTVRIVRKNRESVSRNKRCDSKSLEHVPEKWTRFSDKDMLQVFELARILFDQVIPPDRKAR
jgi:hypothetical protein